MSVARTLLWIGNAEDWIHSAEAAPDAEWVQAADVDEAVALPLEQFDAVVVGDRDLGSARVQRLLAAGAGRVWRAQDLRRGRTPAIHRTQPDEDANERRRGARSAHHASGLIAASPAMREPLVLVERAQHTDATVLLTGETGTGKEVLARAIHDGHARREKPFVAINCAAFPDTLLESELFGHMRGAFTGADRTKKGLFEEAHRGTLFLDEIGETSTPLQAKLLRVLQEREVRAVGGTKAKKVDVRLLAATNRDLRREIHHGAFRADLYYRLAVFPIRAPPLRERGPDVLPLTEHFLALHGTRERKAACRFSREAERRLMSHDWPGNVRELENEVQRALALSDPGDVIPAERLSPRLGELIDPSAALLGEDETLHASMARVERWLLRRALDAHGGRRAETARVLGLTREGLYKKMKRLGIE